MRTVAMARDSAEPETGGWVRFGVELLIGPIGRRGCAPNQAAMRRSPVNQPCVATTAGYPSKQERARPLSTGRPTRTTQPEMIVWLDADNMHHRQKPKIPRAQSISAKVRLHVMKCGGVSQMDLRHEGERLTLHLTEPLTTPSIKLQSVSPRTSGVAKK